MTRTLAFASLAARSSAGAVLLIAKASRAAAALARIRQLLL